MTKALSSPKSYGKKGFTLIELLLDVLLFSIVVTLVTSAIIANLKGLGLGKRKSVAAQIANEKMEILRNMSYDSLATQNGDIYPPGNLPDEEEITREGHAYKVKTRIQYVDDPFDGNALGTIPNKPVDLYPYDYKKAEIAVRYKNTNTVIASVVSNIGAKAAETPTNTGILLVKTIDAEGLAVPIANVSVTNSQVNPQINIQTTTDNSGLVMLPKLPEDIHNNYHIVATKTGYNTDQTYPRTDQNPNALKPDVDILIQQVTSQTLAIDRLSTMNISVVNSLGSPISSLSVDITGDKLIYNNPDTPKYKQTLQTNTQGQINLTNMEWDSYSFSVPQNYFICSTNPYQKVSLLPNTTQDIKMIVTTSQTMPTISSLSPQSQTNNGIYDLTITGTNLVNGITVELKKIGEQDILATNVLTQGPYQEATATFDLTAKPTGIWNLEVTRGSETCTQESAFTITSP